MLLSPVCANVTDNEYYTHNSHVWADYQYDVKM